LLLFSFSKAHEILFGQIASKFCFFPTKMVLYTLVGHRLAQKVVDWWKGQIEHFLAKISTESIPKMQLLSLQPLFHRKLRYMLGLLRLTLIIV